MERAGLRDSPGAAAERPAPGSKEKIQFDNVARIQVELSPDDVTARSLRPATEVAAGPADQVLLIQIRGNAVIVDPLGQCHCPVKPCRA